MMMRVAVLACLVAVAISAPSWTSQLTKHLEFSMLSSATRAPTQLAPPPPAEVNLPGEGWVSVENCYCHTCKAHYHYHEHTKMNSSDCLHACQQDNRCKFALHDDNFQLPGDPRGSGPKCWLYDTDHKDNYTNNDNSYRSPTSKSMYTCFHEDQCYSGYKFVEGDEPNWGHVTSGGSVHNVTTSSACGKLCDAQPKCLSYEHYPTREICNLNRVSLPTAESHEDAVYCTRLIDCQSGYRLLHGDEPEWGNVISGGSQQNVANQAACGDLCTANSACKSYEWYTARSVCNLNNVSTPSDPNQHEDAIFCTKEVASPAPSYAQWGGR